MRNNWRKILSVLLAAAMIVTTYRVPTHAAGGNDEKASNVSQEQEEKLDVKLPKLGEYEDGKKRGGNEAEPDPEEIVRVSIVLKTPAALDAGFSLDNANSKSAKNYRAVVRRYQDNVQAKIEKATGTKLDVKWNFTLAADIISANVKRGDIETIKAVDGVRSVVVEKHYEAPIVQPNTSTSNQMIGADSIAWANGYYGAGSRVMIIDTGTNQNHLSFDPEAFEYALTLDGKTLDDYDLLTQEDIAAVADQLNRTIDPAQAYKNSKIPYAYNYVDGNYTTDHSADAQGEHGSHVSGIAAANRFVKQNGEFVDAIEAVFACGVAPDAQILTAKVFGRNGGASDSDYFAAIEDAIILECDAVNLSLGSAVAGFAYDENAAYQEILDSLVEKGLTVVISAGNAYAFNDNEPTSGMPYLYAEDINMATGGSPGSFVNSFGVAAADNIGTTGTPLTFNGGTYASYSETDYSNALITSIAGDYEYVFINALGAPEDYAAVNEAVPLAGKVVMVFRGSYDFSTKANNALPYDPAAVIIVNNTSGTIYMDLSDYTGRIPVVAITLNAGLAIAEGADAGTAGGYTYFTGTLKIVDKIFSAIVNSDETVTDFSSWGGNGSMLIKPEITAPGGDIWSVNGMTNDGYESMSGTSMAAPHVTGMAAVFAQYYKEVLKDHVDAAFPDKAFSERQLTQSLLMSTASPMFEPGAGYAYYPVLRQGAGLGNVGNAISAISFLMMENDATISAADGKVKAELGQSTEGTYSYSFTIYNPSEQDLIYDLSTDLFTQDVFSVYGYEGYEDLWDYIFMDTWTVDMDGTVSYSFPLSSKIHDVDKDGDTDIDDAQAILDFVSGKNDGKKLDLTTPVADLDEDGEVTSRDSYLLLQFLYSLNEDEEDEDTVLVPAGQSKTVKVSIDVSSWDDSYYPSGMWVEGFTYVTCQSISDDGAILEVEHSIPILGFYGSFTEASMFDANTLVDEMYGNEKPLYSPTTLDVNYLNIKYQDGSKTKFTANPYVVEETFPEGRLALNEDATVTGFNTMLIRGAGTVAVAALALDDNGEPAEVLAVSNMNSDRYPLFFHVNDGVWENTSPANAKTNLLVSSLGLEEGDSVRIGYYAIPEYYAMQKNGGTGGVLTEAQLRTLLLDTDPETVLGAGAYLGYDFTVDNTAPEATVEFDEDTKEITITATDNRYIACIALADLGGTILTGKDGKPLVSVPEQSAAGETVTVKFDGSTLEAAAVAVLVGDYACNEVAKLLMLGNGQITMRVPVYKLTDKLVAGGEYIIASTNRAGTTRVLNSSGTGSGTGYGYPTGTTTTTVTQDEHGTYIALEDAADTFVWLTSGSVKFQNKDDGGWLGYYQLSSTYIVNWYDADNGDNYSYDGRQHQLLLANNNQYGIGFKNGSFQFGQKPAAVYLYALDYIEVPVDPTQAWSITVTPEVSTLVLDVIPTVQLTADVQPVVLEDRGVTWSSSDERVATVDAEGLVTAVGLGSATITATTNARPNLTATVTVNVTEGQSVNAEIYAQVDLGSNGIQFVKINTNDMSMQTVGEGFSAFTGGGRSGNYVYGNDADNDFHRFDITNNYAYDADYYFAINPQYALIDIASYPQYTTVVGNEEIVTKGDFIGFDSNSEWLSIDGDDLSYFRLDSLNTFVAAAFVGAMPTLTYSGTTYSPVLIYAMLGADGMLYFWYQFYDPDNGGESALYADIAHVNVLSIGEDITAYSMAYYYDEDTEVEGLFIADNNSKGIYFVDFSTIDFNATVAPETDALFVGRVEGAANLSTLYNDTYDTFASLDSHSHVGQLNGSRLCGMLHSERVEDVVFVKNVEVTPAEPAEDPTEPVEEETTAPAEEETTAPAEEETTAPAEEETTAPAEEETTAPAEEETTAPAEEETTAPAEDETTAPDEEETKAPDEEETKAPAEDKVKSSAKDETKAPADGGLNAVTSTGSGSARPEGASAPAGRSAETSTEDQTVLTVTADEDVNNGKLTISYDPEALKFVSVAKPAEAGSDLEDLFSSVNVDEEAGTIGFSYATRNAVGSGETLVEIRFAKNCEDTEVDVETEERNEELGLTESETEDVEGSGHDWKLDSVKWEGSDSDGYTKVTFTYVCQNNPDHVKVVVDEQLEVTESGDTVTYKASVTGPDGKTYTEVKTINMSTPDTGDTSNIPLFVAVGGTATVALVGVLCARRKKEKDEE